MKNYLQSIKNIGIRITDNIGIRNEYHISKKAKNHINKKNNRITILNPAIGTDNLGDEIIMHYITKTIYPLLKDFEVKEIPTHSKPSDEDMNYMESSKYVLLCGTNILSPQMELYSGWKIDKIKVIHLNNVILIGVGWWGYQKTSSYTSYVYKHILAKQALHSVRDSQTLNNLNSIGINNVVNTNCLTMWGLDKTSSIIPENKSDDVIITVTSVYNNNKLDRFIIKTAVENYKRVYFWPQGSKDLEYFDAIAGSYKNNILVLERTLSAYTNLLKSDPIDYIGTRLHGGIHAMQNGRRTIIIAVDNRAREIGKDTHAMIIEEQEAYKKLQLLINKPWKTNITLNNKNIEEWKQNFNDKLIK